MNWARVTTTDGQVFRICRVHDDGAGLRFYVNRGRVPSLLAAAPGLRITAWGGFGPRTPDGRRGPKLGAEFDGPLPDPIQSCERIDSCGCGNPLKTFRPPIEWEDASTLGAS